MIMTYGYITLFAAAFPFGSFCTVVFLHIEIRSDLFKLEKLARRPNSQKTHSIGQWMIALTAITYASIFTNLILSCFASNQIDSLVPVLKNYKDFSLESVMFVCKLEHIILAMVVAYIYKYDNNPDWLVTYKHRQTHKMLKKQKISHE